MTMQTTSLVEFYFDPISPYAWLASRQFDRLESSGAQLDFRPVLLAGLLAAHGQKGPAEIPAKRAYTMRDVLRIAGGLGLSVAGPPTHPYNPLRALRMCIALEDAADRRRLGLALLDACWSRGLELSDETVLIALARDCGFDGPALVARAGAADVKRRLIEATESAVAMGIFGVPTFRFDGELFWGEDRIDALVRRLRGQTIDESLLARILARPASAVRKQEQT